MFRLITNRFFPSHKGVGYILLAAATGLALSGCAPPAYVVQPRPEETPPPPSTQLYFYPTQNQTPAQQDRDRYECYLWAVKKTGFDPNRTPLAPHQRVEVIPQPAPGADTAVGAITGAVLGSMLARPREAGKGLAVGAIAGAMVGAASDAAKQQQAQELQRQYDAGYAQDYARAERQARDFRRAMTACLEGRGYTVR